MQNAGRKPLQFHKLLVLTITHSPPPPLTPFFSFSAVIIYIIRFCNPCKNKRYEKSNRKKIRYLRARNRRSLESILDRIPQIRGAVLRIHYSVKNAICARRVKARVSPNRFNVYNRHPKGALPAQHPKITAAVVQLFTSGRSNHVICGQRDVLPLSTSIALIFARTDATKKAPFPRFCS